MTFGINTFLFASPFTSRNTHLFKKFKAWGFDGVEIAVEDPAGFDAVRIRAQLDRHDLVCTSVCACFPSSRDLRGTPAQQAAAIHYVQRLVDIAGVLGTDLVAGPLFSATGRAEAVPAADRRSQWKTVTGHLKELSDYAGERGKVLCLEPLNRFETDFLNTVEQGLRMIHDVNRPALKLLLDTFHMNIEEKNPAGAIRRAGSHVGHFHASASDRGTPGNDHVDWPAAGRALREIGYKGPIVIESFTTDVQVIARAAAIWRKIEPSREAIARQGVAFLKQIFRQVRAPGH